MGMAHSLMDCCTNRDKEDLLPCEQYVSEQRASNAPVPRASSLPSSRGGNTKFGTGCDTGSDQIHMDSSGQRIGAYLTPASLHRHTPRCTTQVDTPKVQDFRLTHPDALDKATEVGCASSLQALPETPQWIADHGTPPAICMEALLDDSKSGPPPPPRLGFHATAVDEEEQTEADVVLTPSSKGVPDPPLAFLEDVAEAARAAEYAEERGESSSSLSSCRQALLRNAVSAQEKHQWSVNSEDSLVAKLAERMHRQRAGRVSDDQQQQHKRRGPGEPQLEAKLADRMEQQLSKERTGVGNAALVRQRTGMFEGGGIGFVDKALERRLEQQRLKAEGMRPQ